jgi:hypothetical protein
MVRAAFTAAAFADVLSAITAVEFYYLNLQRGAATTATTSAAQAASASVGEFEILVALVVAVGAFYAAVALIYRHIHQAEAAAGAGNRPLSDRMTFVVLLAVAAAGLLEFFLFVQVVPCAVDDIVGALGLAAFRALPAAALATFFLGMMLIIVAHVRAGGEGGGGGVFVGDGQIQGAVSILTKTAFAAAAGLFFLMVIALAK